MLRQGRTEFKLMNIRILSGADTGDSMKEGYKQDYLSTGKLHEEISCRSLPRAGINFGSLKLRNDASASES